MEGDEGGLYRLFGLPLDGVVSLMEDGCPPHEGTRLPP